MIVFYAAAPPIAICALLALATIRYRRNRRRRRSTFDSSHIYLAVELRPFIECVGAARYMDDGELWTIIKKNGGLRMMWRAADEFNMEAERRQISDPGTSYLRTRILMTGWDLRWFTVTCLLENWKYGMVPNFPRVRLRCVAILYCDMVSTLQAIPSSHKNLVLSSNNWH